MNDFSLKCGFSLLSTTAAAIALILPSAGGAGAEVANKEKRQIDSSAPTFSIERTAELHFEGGDRLELDAATNTDGFSLDSSTFDLAHETEPDSEAMEIESEETESEPEMMETEPAPDAPAEPFDIDTSDPEPGRTTRSGSSYIGIGSNIGVGDGDTALGETSFSILSKIGLTSNVSFRPSVLVEDDPTVLLPLTLDFRPSVIDPAEDLSNEIDLTLAPFIGAGLAISVGDDTAVDLLATGGLDMPLSTRFTATASLSVSLPDNPAVGLLIGVGYNID